MIIKRKMSYISTRSLSKIFIIFSICVSIFMIVIGVAIIVYGSGEEEDAAYDNFVNDDEGLPVDFDSEEHQHALDIDMSGPTKADVDAPIILWWTPFTGEVGQARKCGSEDRCFFTNNRNYFNHTLLKVLMFYGTSFKADDLPIPRLPHHEWALLHEESPKNQYLFSHESIMTLFNHTCTFKRESDYPITVQHLPSLKWLQSTEFFVSLDEKKRRREGGLAMISYTHSDCDTASDRDGYVRFMMKHMTVDSYGACLHNKDLPKHLTEPLKGMEHEDFYRNQAQYKFVFAFENGICDDYVTEKLWRALHVGTVPVILGSSKIKDLLPSRHSAIVVSDFPSIKALVDYLKHLDTHDDEYNKYLSWKQNGIDNSYLKSLMDERTWGIDNDPHLPNFISTFECFVCNRLHDNINLEKHGSKPISHIATVEHYGCPRPMKFASSGKLTNDSEWGYWWDDALNTARGVSYHINQNVAYGKADLFKTVRRLRGYR